MLTPEDRALCDALEEAARKWQERERLGEGFAVGKAAICRDIRARVMRRDGFASERQRAYAQALVRWTQPRTPAQQDRDRSQAAVADSNSVLMSSTSLQRIVGLFAAATLHGLRYPKIRLVRGEWKIRIYPAPRHSRNFGNYYVKAQSGTQRSAMYVGQIIGESSRGGVIGHFAAREACPLDVIEALREFNDNPQGVATAYGHAVGSCCFCGLTLTDGRSVAMGYGPICAQHYGLPWGEERAQQNTGVLSNAQIVEAVSRDHAAEMARAIGVSDRRLRRYFSTGRPVPPRPRGPASGGNVPLDEEDEDKHFM